MLTILCHRYKFIVCPQGWQEPNVAGDPSEGEDPRELDRRDAGAEDPRELADRDAGGGVDSGGMADIGTFDESDVGDGCVDYYESTQGRYYSSPEDCIDNNPDEQALCDQLMTFPCLEQREVCSGCSFGRTAPPLGDSVLFLLGFLLFGWKRRRMH